MCNAKKTDYYAYETDSETQGILYFTLIGLIILGPLGGSRRAFNFYFQVILLAVNKRKDLKPVSDIIEK